jgi:serine/threonine-protein kinase
LIGKSIAHYNVTDKIGEGGMGEVYKATDSKLNRSVALKVLPDSFANDFERLARFGREAEVLASLNHPNIAIIHGFEQGEGVRALVMELVEGEELADRIQRGALPVDEAVRLAAQIALALEDAHERGIVHRDLKPANVKITPEGRVKVLDFGLAKALEDDASAVDLSHSPTISLAATQAGMILGTAGYMSPEQAAAQPTDRRADIWSFGIILLEMLTGKRAFAGETVSHTLAAVLHGDPDLSGLPDDLPPRLRSLIERCLTKDPRRRLQAIGEARLVLEEYLADPASFSPVAAEPEERPASRLPWLVAAVALVAALGMAMAFVGRGGGADEATRQKRLNVHVSDEPLFAASGASAVLSPDGRNLVLVVGAGQDRSLWVRPVDQLTRTELPGTDVAYNPFISPDGQWIGFATPNELKKVSIAGGTPLSLTDVSRSRGASWGDDDMIVFATNPTSGLSRMPATGGAPEVLTTLDVEAGEVSHRWPHVLPGSRAALFTVFTSDGVPRLEALDLSSGERKILQQGGIDGRYVPSGHLVYANDGTLFAAPFDADNLELLGTPGPVVQGVNVNEGADFSFSNDGTLVYIEGNAGTPTLDLVGVQRSGSFTALRADRQPFVEPRLSPDGKRLAVEILQGGQADAWVLDLERQTSTRLTFDDGLDEVPVWSPDGIHIVFASDRHGRANLYRKRSDGSGEIDRLTESPADQYPSSWSADGRWILFSHTGPETGNDLYVLPVDESGSVGEATPFLVTPFQEAEGAFSPDGRWIAYNSDESGRSEVFVRPFPSGGGKWQISADGGGRPRWARGGRELLYRKDNTVMVVDIEAAGEVFTAGAPRVLFQGPFQQVSVAGVTYADWDARGDGELFVMLRGEGNEIARDHVIFVTDWFDELRSTFAQR